MASWIYILADNERFPDPMEEIAALAAIDEEDMGAFLMLGERSYPPMSRAQPNETIHVCTRLPGNDGLFRHATATVLANPTRYDAAPPSVQPIYGNVANRYFVPIGNFDLQQAGQLPDTVLAQAQQEKLLQGQAFVKRLGEPNDVAAPDEVPEQFAPAADAIKPEGGVHVPPMSVSRTASSVVGLDPTAGTWQSKMEAGEKQMPSVTIAVELGAPLRIEEVAWHRLNRDFCDLVQRTGPSTICIDGPCQTNGPRILDDWSGWDRQANDGRRLCELQLHRNGVHLFWTTNNTVFGFDGASRWIARSLRLFQCDLADRKENAIETHPHGAFSFLWRQLGHGEPLGNKKTPAGRQQRLAILRTFLENADENQLRDHDAVDAACAALVAAFYEVGWVKSYGDDTAGGKIWMPRIPPLHMLVGAIPLRIHVSDQ